MNESNSNINFYRQFESFIHHKIFFDFLEIALNPEVPFLDILKKLTNLDVGYRILVAHNSKISIKLLSLLAKDESVEVRLAVAQNQNTPLDILTVLGEDTNNNISKKAIQTLIKIKTIEI
jgi:hypothetical protein